MFLHQIKYFISNNCHYNIQGIILLPFWREIYCHSTHLSFYALQIHQMVFSFLPKNVHFNSKNTISCLFLKNVSPSKRVICFILNNLHFPMVEGIAFSRVLIISYKADGFCLFIGLPDEI